MKIMLGNFSTDTNNSDKFPNCEVDLRVKYFLEDGEYFKEEKLFIDGVLFSTTKQVIKEIEEDMFFTPAGAAILLSQNSNFTGIKLSEKLEKKLKTRYSDWLSLF